MMRRAQQSGQNPNDYVKHMVEHNHIPELVAEVVRGKALATIVEAAKVVDEAGEPVELKNLRGDGSIGEPEADEAGRARRGADRRLTRSQLEGRPRSGRAFVRPTDAGRCRWCVRPGPSRVRAR